MTDPVMLLSQVHGEGRITYRALTEAGFNTLAAIAAARTEVLSDKAFLSPSTAGRLKAGAKEMLSQPGVQEPGGAGAPLRSDRSRVERIAGGRSGTDIKFSEGIGSVEASLLGQGGPTGVLHHAPSSLHHADDDHEDRMEKPLRADPHYAAFLPDAPAAAAGGRMVQAPEPDRPAPVATAHPYDDTPSARPAPRRSFWSFGANRRGPS